MEFSYYSDLFKAATKAVDTKLLSGKGIEMETGIWLNSVVLRLQKKHWVNDPDKKPQAGAAIFFSVWLNDATIQAHKLYYNIHALKLRQLAGYSITSREFAASFRKNFKRFEQDWPNVSVAYGPQTLMQGWKELDEAHIQKDILELVNKFLSIDFLIDDLLGYYKS